MKQKIVIKVSMHCCKCRTKALKIAAVTEGVVSVALHCPDKDKLMITGDGIDVACLTCSLRKKLCHASLDTVEQVKDKKPEEQKKDEKRNDPKPKPPIVHCPYPQQEFFVVPDPYPSPCNIL